MKNFFSVLFEIHEFNEDDWNTIIVVKYVMEFYRCVSLIRIIRILKKKKVASGRRSAIQKG